MKYDLKTTVFPDGCVVNVHSPQLSEAQRYARSVIKQKMIKEKIKQ